jgi:hypothetical protein
MRSHDVGDLTIPELQQARRELVASLALARSGSAIRVPAEAHLRAIDAELAERSAQRSENRW